MPRSPVPDGHTCRTQPGTVGLGLDAVKERSTDRTRRNTIFLLLAQKPVHHGQKAVHRPTVNHHLVPPRGAAERPAGMERPVDRWEGERQGLTGFAGPRQDPEPREDLVLQSVKLLLSKVFGEWRLDR